MAIPELDKLIIGHLADIDAATKRLHNLQIEIFAALDSAAENWARKNGWVGEFDYMSSELWLAPPEWRVPGTEKDANKFDAWFQMEVGANDTEIAGKPEEDYFHLTRLCRIGSGEIGFRFKQDVITRAQWKKRFRDLTELVDGTAFVADSEQSFFQPFKIEDTKLSESLMEEVIEDALAPFEKALAQLAGARSAFDAIIAAIKRAKVKS